MCKGHLQRLTVLLTSLLVLLGNVEVKATIASNHLAVTPEEGQTVVLVGSVNSIRKINMVTKESSFVVKEQGAGVDYAYHADLLFWADQYEDLILSVNMTTGHPINKVISTDIIEPEGVAVDWIYEHIYWTDSGTHTIGVCDFQGTMRKTLFDTGLDDPVPIAVDPIEGWMIWSDSGKAAKIERAGMDGCCRQSIITTDILWPDALSLDHEDKNIYWLDTKLGTLNTANYDGSGRRTIIADRSVIHHSFGMDVYEDYVYWTDFKSRAIHSANKRTGQTNTTVYTGTPITIGIKVYHHQRQPKGTNYCKNLSEYCSHFCFPIPRFAPTSPSTTCSCPNGKVLATDGLNCENQVTKK